MNVRLNMSNNNNNSFIPNSNCGTVFVTNVPKKVFKFRPIWATCGLFSAYFGFLFLTDTEDTPEYYPRYFSATILRYFPLNGLSKVWGRIAQCYIPEPLRPIVYHSYAKFFQCDLNEVENPNLKSYSCLSEFFIRKISAEKRPIHQTATLVSDIRQHTHTECVFSLSFSFFVKKS
ncbi:unnamed protein product [Trichobilharzia regenti]|nr:unnamed protein product [Trichobilharzia regenti]